MASTHQATSLATILDLSRLVCSTLDLAEVYARILDGVRDLSGAEIVSIMLVDERGEHLRFVAVRGLPPERTTNPSFRLGEGIAGWVAIHGTPVHCVDLVNDPRFVPTYTPTEATLFVLPLKVRNRILGVLNIARACNGALFSAETVQMVEIFASYAAIAIDNAAAATALRYAAVRERIVRLTSQAPREPGAAGRVIEQILTTLAALLEPATTILYALAAEGHFRPVGACAKGACPSEAWQPADPSATLVEIRDDQRSALELRLGLEDEPLHWLVVIAQQPAHFWSRDERELALFAAGQIALLLANERLLRQEQQSRELSETLSQLAAACNALVGQGRLLDYILEQLARFVPYDSSGVFLFRDDHYARLVANRGLRQISNGLVLYMGPGSVNWPVCRDRQAVYLPNVKKNPHWQPLAEADEVMAWIGTPLVVHDRVIGVLTIDKWRPDAFSATDVQVARLFADHVAVAFNNQMLLHEARTRASHIQLLHQLSLRLSAFREPDALLDEVARLLHTTFGYYQVAVIVCREAGLVVQAAYGALNTGDAATVLRECAPSFGLIGYTARTGETVLLNNVVRDPRFVAHPLLQHTAAELTSAIRQDERISGVLIIESEQIGAFGQDDVYLIEAVASQTALALERLRHNEELRRTEERLVQNERLRALGELASGVAHDFNNLLASILGHTQLLLGDALAPNVVDQLRVIERAALDGAASVRRLQGLAQTSKTLPTTPVDLGEIIAESLAITRPRWRDDPQSRGVELIVSHKPGAVPAFFADGSSLRDLVTNLVLNALDAMPQGGQLHLSTALLPPETSPLGIATAQLEVSDTGVGMAPEVQARVFDPFFTTKGLRGTGMGLTMVYGIVERHQGQISVRSQPGQGTTFSVYLPVRLPANEPGAAAQLSQPPPPAEQAPRSVLVVDDDEAVREILARQIRRLGHNVAAADSGEAALARLAAGNFDLICTDLGMPGMSGWELIARARAADAGLSTVLVTGWGEQIDLEAARAQGADAVIAKPFDLARLRQVLDELPRRGRAEG